MNDQPIDLLGDGLLQIHERPASEPDDRPIAARLQTPSPSGALGTCGLCGERPAVVRCLQCERPACKEDSWTMLGLCKGCATPDELKAAREGLHRPRPDLGIKWVED